MAKGIWTDNEMKNAKIAIVAVVLIVVAFLAASYAGYVPKAYNIFEMGEPVTAPPAVTYTAGDADVTGIPEELNVTVGEAGVFANETISIDCTESYVGGMQFVAESDTEDVVVWFTATSTDWSISDDGLTATYTGANLAQGVNITSLVMHVDGTDASETGTITIDATATLGTLDPDSWEIDLLYEGP